ncbi:putative endonuclease 4, partial [Clarias magur]
WVSEDNTVNTVNTANTVNTVNTANTVNTVNTVNITPQGIHKDKHTSSDMPTLSVVTLIVGVSIFITLLLLSFMLWKRH